MPRLRRSDPYSPGLTRRRCGRGFRLLDATGQPLKDPELRARVDALAIPPAWVDVWICPDERGHIQATGIDAAGRRQYRYHDEWHLQRSRRKFREMEAFAASLPALREAVRADMALGDLSRDRVLAAMVRLLDLGFFRIGGEDYAERNGSYGLATIRRDHVQIAGQALIFDYPAKSGQRRVQQIVDPEVAEIVRTLRRRRGGGEELFAYKAGRAWRDVKSVQLNDYLKARGTPNASAKAFRTWGATVLCAVSLAVAESAPPPPRRARGGRAAVRKRVQVQAIREVARYLGNTPAVCRSSYIDPRVLDRHLAGETIADTLHVLGDAPDAGPVPAAVEVAVLDLIRG